MRLIGFVTLFYLVVAVSSVALAGETNPRDYLPAPPGTTIMLTYLKHINADSAYHDGNKTAGFNYEQNLGFFRLVYFNTLFGMPIDYQGLLLYNDQKLNGPAVGGNQFASSGVMDPMLVSTIWPVSSPSTKTWLGFTQYITIPVGEHSNDQVLNPGGNVWVFKEELGLVKGIGDKCFFELQPSIEFHTDNDGHPLGTQSTEPLFQLQAHLSYDITPKFFVAGEYTYQHGGATRTAGVPDPNTRVDSHKAGLTFNYKLSDDYQLMLDYSKTIVTRNGPNLGIAGARFLYVF